MKKLIPIIALLVLGSCQQREEIKVVTDTENLKKQNDSLLKVVDSLRRPEAFTADTLAKNAASAEGKHPITLQWIGWDKPGEAVVVPIGNGWYQIAGSQANEERSYLNIQGTIRRISEKELEFNGSIETHTNYNNGGKPCIKTGLQRFTAKGNRKYYRLQNMENCMGGNVVDYVDIYPGTSGL